MTAGIAAGIMGPMAPMARSLAGAALAVALIWSPARAQDEVPVAPSEFRAFAEGFTLYFSHDGEAFGAEQYFPRDRSVWKDSDGTCQDGEWYARGAQLCFLYEYQSGPLCWRFLRDSEGYFARLLGPTDDAGLELRVIGRDRRPLLCDGPGV